MTGPGIFATGMGTATVAIIVAQGLGKYNLTTTVLKLIGMGETYEKAILAKLTQKYQSVVGYAQKEIGKL